MNWLFLNWLFLDWFFLDWFLNWLFYNWLLYNYLDLLRLHRFLHCHWLLHTITNRSFAEFSNFIKFGPSRFALYKFLKTFLNYLKERAGRGKVAQDFDRPLDSGSDTVDSGSDTADSGLDTVGPGSDMVGLVRDMVDHSPMVVVQCYLDLLLSMVVAPTFRSF